MKVAIHFPGSALSEVESDDELCARVRCGFPLSSSSNRPRSSKEGSREWIEDAGILGERLVNSAEVMGAAGFGSATEMDGERVGTRRLPGADGGA